MNFDDDDSEDSFFEEPKVLSKRASLTKTPEKKAVTDLFNLGGDKLSAEKKDDLSGFDSLGLETKQKSKKISFDDDDDILGNLGFDKKKSETNVKTAKKSDILDSIFAPKTAEEKKKISFDDILKDSKASEEKKTFSFDDILKDSKPSARNVPENVPQPQPRSLEKIPTQSFGLSDTAREGRRARRPSGGLLDPLGLFEKKTDEPRSLEKNVTQTKRESPVPTIQAKTDSDLPDWLAGRGTKTVKSEPVLPQKPPELIQQQPPTSIETVPEQPQPQKQSINVTKSDGELFSTHLQEQKLAHSDMDAQNTFIALQQQESQLLMALQLKKYEESLTEIQRQQQEVLVKQEKQFNIILDRYMSKQQVVENNMRLQQERINNHIQMLLTNTPVRKSEHDENLEKVQSLGDEEALKLHESIVAALKNRHHEEMFIMEESYKKQLTFLEDSMANLEKRLKDDVKIISESNEEKIAALKSSHAQDIEEHKHRYQQLIDVHDNELKNLRDTHSRTIEDMSREHNAQLDLIKQMKEYENQLFKDGSNYSQKLEQSFDVLSSSTSALQNIQENVQNKFNVLITARENSVIAKEKEIALMKETLEKCRESAEIERSQLLAMIRTLESKIAEQTNVSREERWALQQATATLTARAAALDREFDFNKASIDREREQIKTLKESLLAEQEKLMLQLTEEKLAIAAEKSRLDTTAKLATNFDQQRGKAEIEAAIQVARESAEMTDRERATLQRQQVEVEKIRRSLDDRQRRLDEREEELRSAIYEAEQRSKEAERVMIESKSSETKYKERMQELQMRLMSLSGREKKLAEEKIALSKERLAFYTALRQSKKCGLCTVDNNFNDSAIIPDQIFDADASRFRMELIEDERNSEVSKEEVLGA